MMRRALLVTVLAALLVMVSAGAAFAGEWNRGQGYIHGDDDSALNPAASECSYSGMDDPDVEDNFIWESSPAGGHVQSPGQFMNSVIGEKGSHPLKGVGCGPHAGG